MGLDRAEWQSVAEILKSELSKQNITYPKLANQMNVSVSSVKRLLNGGDIKLSQLLEICDVINLSLEEVVVKSKKINLEYFELN